MNPERNRGVAAELLKRLTAERDRGRFELPPGVPPGVSCRFCPEKFRNFDELRFHAQAEHKREFQQVNAQLADIDAKLRSVTYPALEGMRGYKETITGGTPLISGPIEMAIDRSENE